MPHRSFPAASDQATAQHGRRDRELSQLPPGRLDGSCRRFGRPDRSGRGSGRSGFVGAFDAGRVGRGPALLIFDVAARNARVVVLGTGASTGPGPRSSSARVPSWVCRNPVRSVNRARPDSPTRCTARSRNSCGYFLGAGVTSILRRARPSLVVCRESSNGGRRVPRTEGRQRPPG